MHAGGPAPWELVLEEGTRVALLRDLTIGRAADADLRLDDPTVSRTHAVVRVADGAVPTLEDAGSSHGTFLDGVAVAGPAPLRDGARIQLGDRDLTVARGHDGAAPQATVVVPVGASLVLSGAAADLRAPATGDGRPRLRSGVRYKRLEAAEGDRRWIVQEPSTGRAVRLREEDGRLLELLDGSRSASALIEESSRLLGEGGPARLARLVAELDDRGLLSGSAPARPAARPEGWRGAMTPRVWSVRGLERVFAVAYRDGGWLLFTRVALLAWAAIAVAGAVAAAVLVADRYGTPFVVASHLGLGGLVFLAGRLVLVTFHEIAHGLTLASFGRRVSRAGLKVVLVFPYAFVDCTEAWFEPRRRRLAVTAAGPVCDLTLAGAFALGCLLAPAGTARDVLFQVAFAGYVGALMNLNPFLERDGYHLLVDLLGEPRLRERARAQLSARLAGRGHVEASVALRRYAIAATVWPLLAAGLGALLSLRYAPVMEHYAPGWVVWTVLGIVWAVLLTPLVVMVGPPLRERLRGA